MVDEPTLAEIMKECHGYPLHAGIRFVAAQSHMDRIAIIEELVDECYQKLVETRRQTHTMSEDALTVQIVNMLNMVGIPATHDTENGGHCDILIKSRHRFCWIGEAKLYTSYVKLYEGFLQLSTRYGVAQNGSDHGEIIIYHTKQNSRDTLVKWKEYLSKCGKVVLTEGQDFSEKPQQYFRTEHICKSTGNPFFVRHRIVPLYFAPEK